MSVDWPIVKLSDYVKIKHGFAFKSKFFSDEETREILVTPGNFAIGGGFKSDKLKYYKGPVPSEYILNPGDLIITMTDLSKQSDTLGYPSLVPKSSKHLFLHNQRIGLATFNGKEINSQFLYFLMRSEQYRHHILSSATGSTVKHTAPNRIESYEFCMPPLNIQAKIGGFLYNFEEKINLNNQISQTLEAIAQATFKSWFIDFDPVKAKMAVLDTGGTEEEANLAAMRVISSKSQSELEAFKAKNPDKYAKLYETAKLFPSEMGNSELGEIPSGWQCKALDEIAHYQNGLALQKFRPKEGENALPVLKIAQLRQGYTNKDSEELASANIRESCIVYDGDVIFSWSASLMVKLWVGGQAALNQHLFKVTSTDYPKWFYYLYTKRHLEQFIAIAEAKAVTMGHIKREHLSEAMCATPPSETLQKLGGVISPLLDKAVAVQLQSSTLTELRDTLLPRLLSGAIELPIDEECELDGVANG